MISPRGELNHAHDAPKMIKLLKQNGFHLIKSNNGSHQKYYNPTTNITVSVHCKDLKKGLEQALLKQSGLK
ncbi:type II toxin-antitoxin system HicA family toxin [Selenomonas sp. FC4001]|uniref:type II toxin-antitoxin system HicA family toxin n=1 Tax=Selenomonas sp. FC4001 TaxID=1408313 RepID=UPI0012DE7E63